MSKHNLLKHQTKRESLYRFLLLLGVFILYAIYLSLKYDAQTSLIVSAITWSFFVLCTPIADAGFLLDFPIRLIFGIRMFYMELIVWLLASFINLIGIFYFPAEYDKTVVTSIFYTILTTPWPYWIIIVLSGIGTFLSIKFGDELMDFIGHHECKYHHQYGFTHKIITFACVFIFTLILYYHLLAKLDIHL